MNDASKTIASSVENHTFLFLDMVLSSKKCPESLQNI